MTDPVGSIEPIQERLFKVTFENFRSDVARGSYRDSATFRCCGSTWFVRIYPNGADHFQRHGTTYLCLRRIPGSNERRKIRVVFGFNFNNGRGITSGDKTFKDGKLEHDLEYQLSRADPWDRAEIDHNGILEFEVHVRDRNPPPPPELRYVTPRWALSNLMAIYQDEETSDVLFEVVDERDSDSEGVGAKQAKTTTKFLGHRSIIKLAAPALYDMCGGPNKKGNESTPIPISGVNTKIFELALKYIYGDVTIQDDDLVEKARDILDAADKLGIVSLKLRTELKLIDSLELTIENVMDNLLFADAKNLALMKEVCLDFIVRNGKAAIKEVPFDDFPGHLVKDVLTCSNFASMKEQNDGLHALRVKELRARLQQRGLEVDGSREMMIARLQKSYEEEKDSEN